MTIGSVSWDELSGVVKAVIYGSTILIAGVTGWNRMDAKVEAKADRVELQRVEREVNAVSSQILVELRELRLQNEQMTRFICRQNPNGLGC